MVDPQDSDTYNAIGSKSYNTIMGDLVSLGAGTVGSEEKERPEEDFVDFVAATTATLGEPSPGLSRGLSFDDSTGSVPEHQKARKGDLEEEAELLRAIKFSDLYSSISSKDLSLDSTDARNASAVTPQQGELIKDFLKTNASQLTVYGLICLQEELKECELCVFFRNNHFNTMFTFGGQLYLLATDQGYINQRDLVWGLLSEVNGNTVSMTGSFKEFRATVEYVEDMYKFYKLAEHETRVFDYIDFQPGINQKMRAILIDWLIEVHNKFELMPETLYIAINILDRYLSTKSVARKELQLVGGISSMLTASKYEEIWAPEVNYFTKISDNAYTNQQVLVMEKKILGKLEWNLTVPRSDPQVASIKSSRLREYLVIPMWPMSILTMVKKMLLTWYWNILVLVFDPGEHGCYKQVLQDSLILADKDILRGRDCNEWAALIYISCRLICYWA